MSTLVTMLCIKIYSTKISPWISKACTNVDQYCVSMTKYSFTTAELYLCIANKNYMRMHHNSIVNA